MSDAHDEHESLINTPQQLIAVVVLSFVVFVGLAMLVAQFVSSGIKGAKDGSAEATAKAIQPVARIEPRLRSVAVTPALVSTARKASWLASLGRTHSRPSTVL